MGDTNISTLSVSLVAETAKFTSGMQGAMSLTKTFETAIGVSMANAAASVANMAKSAMSSMVNFAAASMESIDKIAKSADTIGSTTEALVGLQHAANLSGISAEDLNSALVKMMKEVGTSGTGDAVKGFQKVAQEIQAIEDPVGRVQKAMEVFGKSGASLLPVLNTNAIREGLNDAEKLGITFSRFDASKVEAANDAITRMGEAFKGLANQAAITFSGIIKGVADAITAMLRLKDLAPKDMSNDPNSGNLGNVNLSDGGAYFEEDENSAFNVNRNAAARDKQVSAMLDKFQLQASQEKNISAEVAAAQEAELKNIASIKTYNAKIDAQQNQMVADEWMEQEHRRQDELKKTADMRTKMADIVAQAEKESNEKAAASRAAQDSAIQDQMDEAQNIRERFSQYERTKSEAEKIKRNQYLGDGDKENALKSMLKDINGGGTAKGFAGILSGNVSLSALMSGAEKTLDAEQKRAADYLEKILAEVRGNGATVR